MNNAAKLLKPEECALVVIDIQEKLIPFIYEKDRVIRNTKLLINLAKIIGLPIILTTQYTKGLGQTIEDIVSEIPDIEPIDKLEFGCFGNKGFCGAVENLPARKTLLTAGIESHICVTQTVLGALNQGYNVHVPTDSVSSRTESNWQVGLHRMEQAGAVLSSTEMIIYELLYQSGTSAFKQMLPYLK